MCFFCSKKTNKKTERNIDSLLPHSSIAFFKNCTGFTGHGMTVQNNCLGKVTTKCKIFNFVACSASFFFFTALVHSANCLSLSVKGGILSTCLATFCLALLCVCVCQGETIIAVFSNGVSPGVRMPSLPTLCVTSISGASSRLPCHCRGACAGTISLPDTPAAMRNTTSVQWPSALP